MKDRSAVIYRTVLAGLMAGFFAGPACAGFEWTPPPAAPAVSSEGPDVTAAPSESVDAAELMPVPGSEVTPAAETTPVVEEASPPSLAIESESTALPPSDFPETLDAPAASGPYATAVGFGSDIPLALALGQIVPAEFAYSFASNVNPGLKVSWNGGKPWDVVLNESLESHGLHADVIGTTVVIRNAAQTLETPVNNEVSEPDESAASPHAIIETPPTPLTRGEGTADNYPRRSPSKKNFMSSIFTSEEAKGNQAPPPPYMEEQGVTVENEVVVEDEPVANEAAAYEPAAPAATAALPEAKTEQVTPALMAPQKISYADEEMTDGSSIMPNHTVASDTASAKASSTLDPFKVSFWQADNNQSLKDVLNGWAEMAGVEVIWDSGYDYKLPNSISMHGTFPEAVNKVFSLYGSVEPRPQGKLHPNLPKGPSVLLVENYP